MIEVELTEAEIEFAGRVGVMRQFMAISQKYRPRYGCRGDPWQIHVDGAEAELAVAKYLGIEWVPSLERQREGEHDVGELEVRSTRWRNGHLMLHPPDPDDAWFVLVISMPPRFRLAGCIRARDGKRDEWWRATDRAAYWVPQSALLPMPVIEP